MSAKQRQRPTLADPSFRYLYLAAGAMGVVLTLALVGLAWQSVVRSETQKFSAELGRLTRTLADDLDDSHDVVHAAGAFVAAAGSDSQSLEPFLADTLAAKPAVAAAALVRIGAGGGVAVRGAAGTEPGDKGAIERFLSLPPGAIAGAVRAASARPFIVPLNLTEAPEYWLLRAVDGVPNHFVIAAVEKAPLLEMASAFPDLDLALYLEAQDETGRQQLYRRAAGDGRLRAFTVLELDQVEPIPFNTYSMKLTGTKSLDVLEIDKGLIGTALLIGTGITLLLVALARAKELQNLELIRRNQVIEEQVARQTRELAIARDEAVAASKIKSEFLASMSHEIRTPLNAIVGMAELLDDTELDADQARYVGVFRKSGEALLTLVNDILDFSKIEAGELTLERIPYSLREIVAHVIDIYTLKADEKGVALTAEVDDAVPGVVVGDPARVRQVLLNLVGNALKFTEAGSVTVFAGTAEGDGQPRLEVAVVDTGIGIPEDKCAGIFESFTQVDSSTTRRYGGTGLGLAICRRLVELMGGGIGVDSEPGAGSRFHFTLPLEAVDVVDLGDAATGDGFVLPATASGEVNASTSAGAEASVPKTKSRTAATGRPTAEMAAPTAGSAASAPGAAVPPAGATAPADEECSADVGGEAAPAHGDGTRPASQVTASVRAAAEAPGAGPETTAGTVEPVTEPLVLTSPPGTVGAPGAAPEGAMPDDRAGSDAVAAGSEAATERRARILLVEDNVDNRLLIRAYLKALPYDVVEAEDGEQALAAFREDAFDLVLMDVQMPVMDGYTATRAMRTFEAESGRVPVPILALTANAVAEDLEHSRAAGCSDHLTKPIRKKTLLAALDGHLGKL